MLDNSENTILKDLLIQTINIQKKKMKWNFFLKIFYLFFFILCIIFFFLKSDYLLSKSRYTDHIAIIDINGIIDEKHVSNARNIIIKLNEAYFNKHTKALILRINSSGGSAVQSNIIYNHIIRLRKVSDKPIYSVIEDIGTSGAYLIAVATEKIYCNQASIIGSIGVIMNTFGYSELIKKIGIERRIYKSSKYKAFMDPFLEKSRYDDEIIQHNINVINKYLINVVKKNRYMTLSVNCDIFSGQFWVGKEAFLLGLVDGFYDIYTLAYDIFNINNIIEYNYNSHFFSILNFK